MSADTASETRRDRLKLVDATAETAQPAEPATARKAHGPQGQGAPAAAKAGAGRAPLKRGILTVVAAAAVGIGLWYGVDWWRNGRFIVSTDDAYVGAEMATISAKLPAHIAAISVVQNQEVKAGQPLVRLDDGDQRIAQRGTLRLAAGAAAVDVQAVAELALLEIAHEAIDARNGFRRRRCGKAEVVFQTGRARLGADVGDQPPAPPRIETVGRRIFIEQSLEPAHAVRHG